MFTLWLVYECERLYVPKKEALFYVLANDFRTALTSAVGTKHLEL